MDECRVALATVLPLAEHEIEFLNRLLDLGEIEPSLLTDDLLLCEQIRKHPALEWKAVNVRSQRSKRA